MIILKKLFCSLIGLSCFFIVQAQTFTQIANTLGINRNGVKTGGLAWGDFNNDDCLDLIVNTNDNRSYLYVSNCANDPNLISFTDVTNSLAAGLTSDNLVERSLVWADFNNDGFLDFARNGSKRIEIYINKGPFASPAYSFGDNLQNPNYVLTDDIIPELNSEGMGWADINGDGWLDLVFDNHGNGTEVFFKDNNLDPCNEGFTFVEGSTIGLIPGSTSGDYLTLGDLNKDGWVDLLVRKEGGANDLYINNQDGTFTLNTNFSETTADNSKGGAVFCDFDNDGDLDIFWNDAARNVFYENEGGDPITFTIHDEGPIATGSGIQPNRKIFGCACGDVDHDGDLDLFLAARIGTGFLYKNDLNNGNPFKFIQDNGNITQNRNARSVVLVDYDNDGDLDVSLNIDNNRNQLWRNSLITNATPAVDKNFLKVRVFIDNPDLSDTNTKGRDAIGAIVELREISSGNLVGMREVNGGRGHGSQDPLILHFGLPNGPSQTYEVTVTYPHMNGSRFQTIQNVRPIDLSNQTLEVSTNSTTLNIDICSATSLPIDLGNFTGEVIENAQILLSWQTIAEQNNQFFMLERSKDAEHFEAIAQVEGAGNSTIPLSYHYLDAEPHIGYNYYRLRSVSFQGEEELSSVIAVPLFKDDIRIYPSPATEIIYMEGNQLSSDIKVEILNTYGELLKSSSLSQEGDKYSVSVKDFDAGIYLLKIDARLYKIVVY